MLIPRRTSTLRRFKESPGDRYNRTHPWCSTQSATPTPIPAGGPDAGLAWTIALAAAAGAERLAAAGDVVRCDVGPDGHVRVLAAGRSETP